MAPVMAPGEQSLESMCVLLPLHEAPVKKIGSAAS